MMKGWILLYMTVSAVLVAGTGGEKCAGCPEEAEADQRIVDFAMSELAGLSTAKTAQKVVRVTNPSTQVVAGQMFRMTLELGDTSCPIKETLTCEETPTTVVETCEVAVWEKVWEKFIKLQSFDCKRKDKRESSYKNKSELHRVKLTKGVSNAKITTFDKDQE